MKKHLFFAACLATALFSACNNNEVEQLTSNEGTKVSFAINRDVARATTTVADSKTTTTFEDNDIITLYSKGLLTEIAGTQYKVNGTSLVYNGAESEPEYCYNGTNGATFYAYYPETAVGTTTGVSCTVATDQATTGYGKSDFMTSKTVQTTASNEAVTLTFKHRMTLVKIDVSAITSTIDISSVELNNVKPTATWTYETDAVEASGDASTIKLGENSSIADKTEYWAIIPAQTINKTAIVTIKGQDKNGTTQRVYNYTPESDVTFTEGKIYELTLSLSGNQVVSTSINKTVAWGDSDTQTGSMDERVIALIDETTGTFTTDNAPTTVSTFNPNLTENQWYIINKSTLQEERENWKYDNSENGYKLSFTSTTENHWYDTHLGFRLSAASIKASVNKIFTISFTIKSNVASQGFRVGVMKITKSSDNKLLHFKLDTNKGYNAFTVSTAEMNKTYTVDFNYLSTDQGDTYTDAPNATETDYEDVVIYFCPNNSTETFWINKVTAIEAN